MLIYECNSKNNFLRLHLFSAVNQIGPILETFTTTREHEKRKEPLTKIENLV